MERELVNVSQTERFLVYQKNNILPIQNQLPKTHVPFSSTMVRKTALRQRTGICYHMCKHNSLAEHSQMNKLVIMHDPRLWTCLTVMQHTIDMCGSKAAAVTFNIKKSELLETGRHARNAGSPLWTQCTAAFTGSTIFHSQHVIWRHFIPDNCVTAILTVHVEQRVLRPLINGCFRIRSAGNRFVGRLQMSFCIKSLASALR